MADSDIPAEAVEAAARALTFQSYVRLDDWTRDRLVTDVLAAALPHIRANERARVLAEVTPAIERLMPCRCQPAWTERNMHSVDCLLEIREDVLDVLGDS